MTKEEYTRALERLGFDHTDAAEHLHVHRVSSTRWGSGARTVPAQIETILNLTGLIVQELGLNPKEAAALAQAWGRGNGPKPVRPTVGAAPHRPRRTAARG